MVLESNIFFVYDSVLINYGPAWKTFDTSYCDTFIKVCDGYLLILNLSVVFPMSSSLLSFFRTTPTTLLFDSMINLHRTSLLSSNINLRYPYYIILALIVNCSGCFAGLISSQQVRLSPKAFVPLDANHSTSTKIALQLSITFPTNRKVRSGLGLEFTQISFYLTLHLRFSWLFFIFENHPT